MTAERKIYTLEVEVVKVIRNFDGFSILKVKNVKGRESIAVGSVFEPHEGMNLFIRGFMEDGKYGKQFRITAAKEIEPQSVDGIRRYLELGNVKGVGKKTAQLLVDGFGERALSIIKSAPERVAELPGMTVEKAEKIANQLREKTECEQVAAFLHDLPAIGPAKIRRIQAKYGDTAVQRIKDNPYLLIEDITGIGFDIADKIARKVKLQSRSPERIEAIVVYALEKHMEDGHVCIPVSDLAAAVAKLFNGIERKEGRKKTETEELSGLVTDAVQQLIQRRRLIEDSGSYYLPKMFEAEERLAMNIWNIASSSVDPWTIDLAAIQKQIGKTYAPEQAQAIQVLEKQSIVIVSGGPGTGKTTLIQGIIEAAKMNKCSNVLLCAPTGRAAKRMTEATGMPAQTVHSALEYNPDTNGFARNRNYPIKAGLIIADEFSMSDLLTSNFFFDAIPKHCRVVIVGDVNQLAAVDPGDVLNQLIKSKCIPTVMLSQIYRQGKGSTIAKNAQRILEGKKPVAAKDFLISMLPEEIDETAVEEKLFSAMDWILNYAKPKDVQILAPKKKGKGGVDALNQKIQQRYNGKTTVSFTGVGGRIFKLGDRVMETKNRKKLGITNGELGMIVNIVDPEPWEVGEGENPEDFRYMQVDYDGTVIKYYREDTDKLYLAASQTMHKSQGSEFPVVIMLLLNEAIYMLNRNIFYTAETRGKQIGIVIAQEKALRMAVRKLGNKRHSLLAQRIQTYFSKGDTIHENDQNRQSTNEDASSGSLRGDGTEEAYLPLLRD